jgi:hypothetical protein
VGSIARDGSSAVPSARSSVAQDAAILRAGARFSPPDTLIVGTGPAAQVGHLVTNDRGWAPKLAAIGDRIRVLTLADQLPFR